MSVKIREIPTRSPYGGVDVIHTAAPDRGKLMTLIAGKWRCLLFTGDGRQSVYDKKNSTLRRDNRTTFTIIKTLPEQMGPGILRLHLCQIGLKNIFRRNSATAPL